MRTNIVLDDKLVKREVIHEALRTLILLREQAQLHNLRGMLKWAGDLNDQRSSRIGSG
jgi:hypothetical protein